MNYNVIKFNKLFNSLTDILDYKKNLFNKYRDDKI